MGSPSPPRQWRIALLTHGFDIGGGVPSVARWLRSGLQASGGYVVDVHDLATSSRDPSSRRLVAPTSWMRPSLRSPRSLPADRSSFDHWGANAVELEFMRYRPRYELDEVLRRYDLVQVIAGAPAWAAVTARADMPVVLQVATTAAWERRTQLETQTGALRLWRHGMTAMTSRVERSALRLVDAVLVENTSMAEYVRSTGQAKVIKAHPGVDTSRFSPSNAGWRPDGHLLSVCRLSEPRKGLERMILAYGRMLERQADIPPLVLAGRGRPSLSLAQVISRTGVASRVTIRSDVNVEELVDLYRGASVFVQTSYEEGLGLAVLEAMACGLPVVSTETAGTRESVVDGKTGWLIPQSPPLHVPDMVAERVLAVLAGDGATLAAGARSRAVTRFSTDVTLSRFTRTYEHLLRDVALRAPLTAGFSTAHRPLRRRPR
jgi:glycosyltransferase involved in cell wall biosynthesis